MDSLALPRTAPDVDDNRRQPWQTFLVTAAHVRAGHGAETDRDGLLETRPAHPDQRRLTPAARQKEAEADGYSLRQLFHFHEEPWRESPHLRFSFWQFVSRVRRSNVARFAICYLLYTSVQLAASITGFLTSPGWGRVSDRLGNYAVLRCTVLGVSVMPFLWALSGHPAWVAFLSMAGALLWGGLNLTATNFQYDAVSPPKRHTCLAYFNVVDGSCVALGAFVGGWAIGILPPIGGSGLHDDLRHLDARPLRPGDRVPPARPRGPPRAPDRRTRRRARPRRRPAPASSRGGPGRDGRHGRVVVVAPRAQRAPAAACPRKLRSTYAARRPPARAWPAGVQCGSASK